MRENIQPDMITIDAALRLRKYDGRFDFAYPWYQDVETVYLVDGIKEPYTADKLRRMYEYLDAHGELYFIEILRDGKYIPIGDVTFGAEDMPIVIGDSAYRGRGIGKKVIRTLIQRGRTLGLPCLYVREIYTYNTASAKCFESLGFRPYAETQSGRSYKLELI
ncbi:MAG: GNAT family N-acetyltransferase [Ruminococcus sp.]|nr:GNAT family N-acetyltransferase [Ruminococcus sp.]